MLFSTTLTNFLFPKFCFGCTREGAHLCADCLDHLFTLRLLEGVCVFCGGETLRFACRSCNNNLGLTDILIAMSFHQPIMSTLIHAWKFKGLRDLTAPLAQLIITTLRAHPPDHRNRLVIVAMPMHWIRERRRGYNHSELLARELSRELALPFATVGLRRRWSPQQAKMNSAHERAHNVRDSIICSPRANFSQQHILLVDDITTSGHTLAAAAQALHAAGAASITAAVVAKG